jgi:hypothetical protein
VSEWDGGDGRQLVVACPRDGCDWEYPPAGVNVPPPEALRAFERHWSEWHTPQPLRRFLTPVQRAERGRRQGPEAPRR